MTILLKREKMQMKKGHFRLHFSLTKHWREGVLKRFNIGKDGNYNDFMFFNFSSIFLQKEPPVKSQQTPVLKKQLEIISVCIET
jgi:hypothetical protein